MLLTIETVEREEKQALKTYCESTPATRFAHALHEEAEDAKAKFCPVYAESRRIAALDDCQGPPYIGTEGGVPDSFVMAAMAEDRRELEDERLLQFVESVLSPETTSLKREWKSILKARKDPMWETGIKPAIQREITKVFEELQTVKVCSYQEYEARRLAHPDRTVLLNALMPIIGKLSVDGEFTKVKSRLVVADSVEISKMGDVYAPTVQADTVRRQANLEIQLLAHSVTLDASDAYHLGTPLDPLSKHGRFVYVRPIKDLVLAGLDPKYSDKRNVWSVTGNVPGLQNAGVCWGDHFGDYLKRQGYSQSVVDRRLYFRREPEGTLSLVYVYVDDNLMISTSKEVRDKFVISFEQNSPNSVAPGTLAASVATK